MSDENLKDHIISKPSPKTPWLKMIGLGVAGVFVIGILAELAVAYLVPGSFQKLRTNQASGAAPSSNTETVASSDDWELKQTNDAIDGKVVEANKAFEFEDKHVKLLVALRCVAKERDIKISLESYNSKADADNQLPGDPFVTSTEAETLGQPLGRVKLHGGEPIPLGSLFSKDGYTNVIAWKVLPTAGAIYAVKGNFASPITADLIAQLRALDDPNNPQSSLALFALAGLMGESPRLEALKENVLKVGAGNLLGNQLPMVIEVQNTGGTEQLVIPREDAAIAEVVANCTAQGMPDLNKLSDKPSETAAESPSPNN